MPNSNVLSGSSSDARLSLRRFGRAFGPVFAFLSELVSTLFAMSAPLVASTEPTQHVGVSAVADSIASGTIVGLVTVEGEAAYGANILVVGTRIGSMIREDGWFSLDHVPAGKKSLIVDHPGCERQLINTVVVPGRADTVLIALSCPLLRCAKESKERLTAGCFQPNPEEQLRVGMRCQLHRSIRLVPDTVRIGYGLRVMNPDFIAAEHDSFPNARMQWDGGCVLAYPAFTNVAYCGECRRAFERWRPKK